MLQQDAINVFTFHRHTFATLTYFDAYESVISIYNENVERKKLFVFMKLRLVRFPHLIRTRFHILLEDNLGKIRAGRC